MIPICTRFSASWESQPLWSSATLALLTELHDLESASPLWVSLSQTLYSSPWSLLSWLVSSVSMVSSSLLSFKAKVNLYIPSQLSSLVNATPYDTICDQTSWQYSSYNGFKQFASGLCCGLSSLAAGLCIGIAGDAGVRANAQKDIYVGVILILIFAEALGLYGLIISIILSSTSTNYWGRINESTEDCLLRKH